MKSACEIGPHVLLSSVHLGNGDPLPMVLLANKVDLVDTKPEERVRHHHPLDVSDERS